MKKIFLVLLMGLVISPTYSQEFIGKNKKKKKHNVEVVSEIQPIKRVRWIEREGQYYVIVSRTTISREDYLRIKNTNR